MAAQDNLGRQFDNVFSLDATRKVKERTGKGPALRMTSPETPEFARHADEAIGLNAPDIKVYHLKEQSLKERASDKVQSAMRYIGLID